VRAGEMAGLCIFVSLTRLHRNGVKTPLAG
jgi:hypothetical protein